MRTFLKFAAAVVAGWVIAGMTFSVAIVIMVNRRMGKYNGYLKVGPK